MAVAHKVNHFFLAATTKLNCESSFPYSSSTPLCHVMTATAEAGKKVGGKQIFEAVITSAHTYMQFFTFRRNFEE